MERLTDPGKIIIPSVTDLQSFEYAKVYERLKEYENAVDAEEFLTFRHAKEHSLLPAFQHIVIAKVLNGTASIKYEKEEDDHIKVSIYDYKGVNLINVWVKLNENACTIKKIRYLEDY